MKQNILNKHLTEGKYTEHLNRYKNECWVAQISVSPSTRAYIQHP